MVETDLYKTTHCLDVQSAAISNRILQLYEKKKIVSASMSQNEISPWKYNGNQHSNKILTNKPTMLFKGDFFGLF